MDSSTIGIEAIGTTPYDIFKMFLSTQHLIEIGTIDAIVDDYHVDVKIKLKTGTIVVGNVLVIRQGVSYVTLIPELQIGNPVLLLTTKDKITKFEDITKNTTMQSSYTLTNSIALPINVAESESKVSVLIDKEGNIEFKGKGNVNIVNEGDVNVENNGKMTVTSQGNIDITGAKVNINNGHLEIT